MESVHIRVRRGQANIWCWSRSLCAGVLSGQSRRFPQFLQSPQVPAEEPGDGEAGRADCYTLRHPEGVPSCQIPRVSSRGRSWGILEFRLDKFFKLNVEAAARIVMCNPLSLNTAISQVHQCAVNKLCAFLFLFLISLHIPLFSVILTVSTKTMPPWLSWFRTNWMPTRLMTPPWERSEAINHFSICLFFFFFGLEVKATISSTFPITLVTVCPLPPFLRVQTRLVHSWSSWTGHLTLCLLSSMSLPSRLWATTCCQSRTTSTSRTNPPLQLE